MNNITHLNMSSTTSSSLPNATSSSNLNTTLPNLNSTAISPLVNSTNELFEMYSSTAKIVAYSVVYGWVTIIALAGNIMVFIVMFMNRTMHTATNVLLLNLSLSDILFTVFAVPGFLSMEIYNDRWIFTESMGKMTQQSTILCGSASVFTMIAIAFERYLAVVYPLKQMARKKKTTIIIAMAVIWFCAISLSIPLGYYSVTVVVPRRIKRDGQIVLEQVAFLSTTMTKVQSKAYTMMVFICINVIPILFLGSFYSCIVWKLWNPDQRLVRETVNTSVHQKSKNFVEKTRRKTTTMLITVVLVFFLCMFPYNLFQLLLTFRGEEEFNLDILRHANSILRTLLLVNSASNPIIYNFLSNKFRTGFTSIFACRWHSLRRVGATTDVETVLT